MRLLGNHLGTTLRGTFRLTVPVGGLAQTEPGHCPIKPRVVWLWTCHVSPCFQASRNHGHPAVVPTATSSRDEGGKRGPELA